jgi:hypothetical protein
MEYIDIFVLSGLLYSEKSLVWLMVFSATFNNIQLYRGSQFYWWRKPPSCLNLLTSFITQCCI